MNCPNFVSSLSFWCLLSERNFKVLKFVLSFLCHPRFNLRAPFLLQEPKVILQYFLKINTKVESPIKTSCLYIALLSSPQSPVNRCRGYCELHCTLSSRSCCLCHRVASCAQGLLLRSLFSELWPWFLRNASLLMSLLHLGLDAPSSICNERFFLLLSCGAPSWCLLPKNVSLFPA